MEQNRFKGFLENPSDPKLLSKEENHAAGMSQ
jgi:hypothetical protein